MIITVETQTMASVHLCLSQYNFKPGPQFLIHWLLSGPKMLDYFVLIYFLTNLLTYLLTYLLKNIVSTPLLQQQIIYFEKVSKQLQSKSISVIFPVF